MQWVKIEGFTTLQPVYYCVVVVLSNEFKGKQMKGLHKNIKILIELRMKL